MGTPAFDKMLVADVKPAMLKAMELNLEEIEAIASNPEAPSFENTIEAMERSGKVLDRAFAYYGIFSSNMSSPEFRTVQAELAPLFSDFQSKITQNEQLFQRIKAVYQASKEAPLPADKQRVVELTYQGFAMNGADLSPEKRSNMQRLTRSYPRFIPSFQTTYYMTRKNYVTYLTEDQLGGLPDDFIKSAAQIAAAKENPMPMQLPIHALQWTHF